MLTKKASLFPYMRLGGEHSRIYIPTYLPTLHTYQTTYLVWGVGVAAVTANDYQKKKKKVIVALLLKTAKPSLNRKIFVLEPRHTLQPHQQPKSHLLPP